MFCQQYENWKSKSPYRSLKYVPQQRRTSLCHCFAGITPRGATENCETRLLFGSPQSAIDPFIQLGAVPAKSFVTAKHQYGNRIAAPGAAHFTNPANRQVQALRELRGVQDFKMLWSLLRGCFSGARPHTSPLIKGDVRLSLSSGRPKTGARLGSLGEAVTLCAPDTDSCLGCHASLWEFGPISQRPPRLSRPSGPRACVLFDGGLRRQG